jgi:hypothetical protein
MREFGMRVKESWIVGFYRSSRRKTCYSREIHRDRWALSRLDFPSAQALG